ncbi:MAG TPA: hypothetical protein VJH90_03395 [archaeon]|nr:hypothetical protein [archaeon]
MAILASIATLLSLIVGIIIGEMLSTRVFGKVKPKFIFFDIAIFVVVISVIYNLFDLSSYGILLYVINMTIGLVTIVSTRTIGATLKFTEKEAEEDKLVVNIIRALSRYGLDNEEIKGVLKRSGVNPSLVDKYSEFIDESIPAYAPKLLKMGNELDEIKDKLGSLQGQISNLKTNDLHELKSLVSKKKSARKTAKKTNKKKKR